MSYKFLVTDKDGSSLKAFDSSVEAVNFVREHAKRRNEVLLVFKSECVLSSRDIDLNAIRSNITKD